MPLTHHRLRPGLRVTRRDDTSLQVGLDAPGRVVLPDDPDVRAILEALVEGRPVQPSSAAGRQAYAALLTRGLLVDGTAVDSALARTMSTDPERRAAVAAAFASVGPPDHHPLRSRGTARISIRSLGETALSRGWAETAARTLLASGVDRAAVGDDPEAAAALVLCDSEPDRGLLDASLAAGEPHLLVSVVEGRIRLGPFVVPGVTACLRCVDAHLDDLDDRRSLVVQQYAARHRPSGDLPTPCDPALMTMALAWAARDLVSFVEGGAPSTWSATVTIEPDLSLPKRVWHRHPHCGCCWGDLLDAG